MPGRALAASRCLAFRAAVIGTRSMRRLQLHLAAAHGTAPTRRPACASAATGPGSPAA